MPFFTSNNKQATPESLQKLAASASIQTYDNADYYIANTKTKAKDWNISDYSIADSHDTSKDNGTSGPADHFNYFAQAKASKLSIIHEPTKYAVMFPAILKSYSETFTPKYDSEQLYGRMDPVQKYSSTSRTISVSFTVLGYDEDHAHRNLHALSTLAEFLYPVYDYDKYAISNATAIRESPLWRVRFANLIQRTNAASTNYISNGLLVAPTDFSFQPVLEAGFFIVEGKYNFPKEIEIKLGFNVLHEETMGWLYDPNQKDRKHKWIGNLTTTGEQNQASTIFPWGDYTLQDVALPPEEPKKTANEAYLSSSGTPQG